MSTTDPTNPTPVDGNGHGNGGAHNGSGFVAEKEWVVLGDQGIEAHVVVDDPELVTFAAGGGFEPEPVHALKRLIRLGVLTAQTSRLDASLEEARQIEARLAQMPQLAEQLAVEASRRVRAELAKLIGDGTGTGELPKLLDRAVADGSAKLGQSLGPVITKLTGAGPDALPQVMEARLRAACDQEAKAYVERIFAADGSSPLMANLTHNRRSVDGLRKEVNDLKREVSEHLQKLVTELVRAQSTVPAATAAGGDWERDSLDDLAGLAAVCGDSLELTGASPGHGRVKRGDGVLTLCETGGTKGLKVVIECRTGDSRRVTCADLESAMENRDAQAALLLAEQPAGLPRDAEPVGFRIYLDERMVVLHYPRDQAGAAQLLTVGVQIARALARLAASSTGSQLERTHLLAVCSRIEATFTELRGIRSSATTITKEADKVRSHATRLEASLKDALTDLHGLDSAA